MSTKNSGQLYDDFKKASDVPREKPKQRGKHDGICPYAEGNSWARYCRLSIDPEYCESINTVARKRVCQGGGYDTCPHWRRMNNRR